MIKIKFCGLTRQADIETANELKPDYVGFVFYEKSKRYIRPEQAARLREVLDDDIKPVGVFVDEDPKKASELVGSGVIDIVQLHGSESEEYIHELRRLGAKEIWRAFRIEPKMGTDAALETDRIADGKKETGMWEIVDKINGSGADMVLIDSGAGSGEVFDWSVLKEVNRSYILAGGLDPVNVVSALESLSPYGLDVSSGIETDGRKDPDKMRDFIKAVRGE